MHLQVFYERKQSLYNWSSNWYTSSFSLKAKQTKAKKKFLEVGRAKIVTHLQVGVTDLCLELLVTITDSIKLSVISKPGILSRSVDSVWDDLLSYCNYTTHQECCLEDNYATDFQSDMCSWHFMWSLQRLILQMDAMLPVHLTLELLKITA